MVGVLGESGISCRGTKGGVREQKMTKFEVRLNSPVSSPSPSPPELPSQLKRKTPAAKTETTKKQKPEANILCIEEGINDPYVYHPVSPTSPQLPAHLSAPSPLMSSSPQLIERAQLKHHHLPFQFKKH
jgi:hypothetical protein